MNLIETLEKARNCNLNIDSKIASQERLYFLIEHVTRTEDAEKLLKKAATLEREVNDCIDALVDARRVANGLIATLAPDEQVILEQYYINGLGWDKVAEKTHFSIRKVYNLRKSAFASLGVCDVSACD